MPTQTIIWSHRPHGGVRCARHGNAGTVDVAVQLSVVRVMRPYRDLLPEVSGTAPTRSSLDVHTAECSCALRDVRTGGRGRRSIRRRVVAAARVQPAAPPRRSSPRPSTRRCDASAWKGRWHPWRWRSSYRRGTIASARVRAAGSGHTIISVPVQTAGSVSPIEGTLRRSRWPTRCSSTGRSDRPSSGDRIAESSATMISSRPHRRVAVSTEGTSLPIDVAHRKRPSSGHSGRRVQVDVLDPPHTISSVPSTPRKKARDPMGRRRRWRWRSMCPSPGRDERPCSGSCGS